MARSWTDSQAYRQLAHGLAVCRAELILPIRALRNGHLPFLGYTILVIALGIWSARELIELLVSALRSANDSIRLEAQTFQLFALSISGLIWLLTVPIFITAFALPVRVIWMRGHPYSFELVSRLFPSIAKASKALGVALRLEFRFLIPLITMIVLYFGFAARLSEQWTGQLFLLGLIGVAITTVWKSLPVILSPVLAVAGQMEGRDAVRFSEQVFRPKTLEFITVVLCTIGLWLGIFLHFHGRQLTPRMSFSWLEISLHAAVLWYAACMICFKTLQALAEASLREAPPQQPAPIAVPPPVIHVENLWVQDEDGKFRIKKP